MKSFFIAVFIVLGCYIGYARESESLLLPSASISGNATVCQNATGVLITFTGSGGTAPYTFTYHIGSGGPLTVTSVGNTATIPVNTATAGTFVYYLDSVHDTVNTAEQSSSGIVTIVVNSLPVVDFIFTNDNSCSGTPIQFTSTVSGAGSFNYSWDFGDSSPLSSQTNPTHTFTSLGCNTATFTVTLTITGGGCTATKTKTIIVQQKPDISFTDTNNPADPFSNCSGATTNPVFTVTLGNLPGSNCITSYSVNWDVANPTIVNNVTFPISHTYGQLGVYTIAITAVGNNGCSNTVTYQVKNISSPGGGLSIPNNIQNLCAPTPNIDIAITNWGTNSLDTTYSINYGDPTSSVVFTQNQLVNSSYYVPSNPASSAAYPIPHSYTVSSCPTYYTITLNITNACNANPPQTATIYVITKPVANFTAPTKACITTNVLFTNTTTPGYGNNCSAGLTLFTWDFGDPASGISNNINTGYVATIPNANHTFSGPGLYTVTLTAQNVACGQSIKTQQICIESPLIPQFSLNTIEGCSPLNVSTTNNTAIISCSIPTYQWDVTYVSGFCGIGLPVWSYTQGSASTADPKFNFVTPGTYLIKLSMTNSCGEVSTSTQNVIVKKPPQINSIDGILSNYCGSTLINPIAYYLLCTPNNSFLTYAWSFPGGTPSSSTAVNPGSITYPAGGPYTVSLVVTNECGPSNTATQTFTVNTAPTITNTNLSQTVCSGSPTTLVNLTANPTGTTFSWTATATPGISGFIPSGTTAIIPVQTIITSNSSPGTVTYAITPTVGACAGSTITYVITVNPAPSITTQPVASTVCLGGTPTALTIALSSSSVTPSYQWYSNVTNSSSGGTLIAGATNATYSPPATSVGTLYYYCLISLSAGGCSGLSSAVVPVIVTALPTVTTQPTSTQSLCVGSSLPLPLTVVYTGGTGTASYQWYTNTSASNTGGTLISGATSASYTPTSYTIAGSYYYYVVISLSGNNCGTVASTVSEVVVYSDPAVTTQPISTQTLCQGATPTTLQVVANGGNGTYSYQWYSSVTNNTTGGTVISGATTTSYIPPTTTVGTLYYYCVISQSTLGCAVTSAASAIVINASPTITLQPQSSSLCQGGTASTLTLSYSNGVGTPTYQWYSNSTNNTTGGTSISGATAATYLPPTSSVGVIYYYCLVTFSGLTGGCATIATTAAAISITTAASFTAQPLPNQTLCVGGTIPNALTVSYTDGTGTASYQWFSASSNSATGGTPVGTNADNFTPPVFTNPGTYYYYVTISFSGSGCGAITSAIVQIDVVADPTFATQPIATQTLCQNAVPVSLTAVASGGIGSVYNYQWYSSTTNSSSGGILIGGATNSSYVPPTTVAGTFYYYCTISQANGIGCDATSTVAKVIVNLAPAITVQPLASTVCVGGTPTLLSFVYSNGVGTPIYQWYSNTVFSNSGGTLLVGATSATYNPTTSLSGTAYYYCVITFPSLAGGCEIITTDAVAIIVNDNPIISSTTATICSSTSFTIVPTGGAGNIVPTGTTYTWLAPIVSPPGSITGANAESTPQTIISQSLVNTTTNPATVTYTIVPASGSCIGIPFTITVTVNPAINPNILVTNNSCFGVNTASISTNIAGGIPFISGAPYQISWTGPNSFTSISPTLTNIQPGIYTVTIADAGGCPFTNSYTITEPADIVITTDSETDISCYSANNGSIAISVTGGTGAYSYSWTRNSAPYAVTEDITNLSPGTYVVTVTDANLCGPKTATFTITEPPLLVVSLASQSNVLCFGAATGAITASIVGGTPNPISLDYTYSWTGPNGYTANTQNISNLFAGIYVLTVTDFNGCIKTLTVTITQATEIIIAYTTTPITCYGANNASLSTTLSGGNPPYTFQWNNLSTSLTQTNLSAGSYVITVTDNVGCIRTETIVIPEAPIFTVNPIVTQVSCYGAHNGSINLNLIGGISPVALTWSDGSTAGLIRNNLGPGVYTATISDGTPCYITRTFTIVEPQPLTLSANLTNAFDCTNASSGAVDLVVAGGTMPYTYSWTNGALFEDLVNITSGTYAVTVTDANGCIATATYAIVRQDPIAITVSTQTFFDCSAHTVDQNFVAQVSGGIPPYQLQWSSGTISGTNHEIMHTTINGTVLLTVTDSNNCTATYTVTIDIPILGYPSFTTSSYGYTTYGLYAVGDPIQFNSTLTGDYVSVSWDFGDGTFSTEENPIHTYVLPKDYVVTQTVTYPFGCVYVQKITLIVEKGYVLVVPTAFTPNNDTVNDTYRPVTKGLKNIVLDIYDTWGSLIYSEKGDVLVGWDGKINGFGAENGNYYSKVSAETFYGVIVNSNQTFVLIK